MGAFDQIIGYTAVKQRLERTADVLAHPDAYRQLGARPPRAMLLYGEPGVGKTLMARCLIEASGRASVVCRKDEPNGEFVKVIKKKFKKAKAAEYNRVIKKLKTDEVWDDEMLHTAETYVEHLTERAMEFANEPYIAFEVKVDISDYVPEAFGRCDCVMFGGDTLIITDYKHGKGVPVSPEENPSSCCTLSVR